MQIDIGALELFPAQAIGLVPCTKPTCRLTCGVVTCSCTCPPG